MLLYHLGRQSTHTKRFGATSTADLLKLIAETITILHVRTSLLLDSSNLRTQVGGVVGRSHEPLEHLAGAVHLVTGGRERDRRNAHDRAENRVVVATSHQELSVPG